MYPLLLEPPVKDYLWGGTRLKTDYHFKTDKEKAAEAWVLSCHKDGADTVTNGELAGKTLPLLNFGAIRLSVKMRRLFRFFRCL